MKVYQDIAEKPVWNEQQNYKHVTHGFWCWSLSRKGLIAYVGIKALSSMQDDGWSVDMQEKGVTTIS